MDIGGFRGIKFHAALKEISNCLGGSWKWQLTVWSDNGEKWVFNPIGSHQESRPSTRIDVEVTESEEQ